MDTIVNNSNLSLSTLDNKDRELLARVKDCVRFASEKHCKKFIGFLDDRGLAIAKSCCVGGHCTVYEYGGYYDAQRLVLGFYPCGEEQNEYDFPVESITLKYRKEAQLSHRDFLGSLMGLGIERSCVGDILCEEERCVIFLRDSIVDFVVDSLDKVGKEGVKCEKGHRLPLPASASFKEIRSTVVSARIDSVVATLCAISRARACEKISCEQVCINGLIVHKQTKLVCDGDKITVRGYGKFLVDSIGGCTKKNRMILQARKYL